MCIDHKGQASSVFSNKLTVFKSLKVTELSNCLLHVSDVNKYYHYYMFGGTSGEMDVLIG